MKFEKDFSIAYTQKRSNIWKSLETILLTLLLFLLARYIHPSDPYSLTGPMPWISFVPVYCSLFYGALYGVLSLIIILFSFLLQQPLISLNTAIVREYILGMVGLTFLAGVFSSYWISRIQRVESLNKYVREHLDNLSRDYFLLRISHERIEQSYIIKPLSLRDAFYKMKEEIVRNNGQLNENTGKLLLEIFSQFCSINGAAFCTYNEATNDIKPIAFLGKEFLITAHDPLVINVIKKKTSAYVAVNELSNDISQYIAIIPLINPDRDIIGFVAIKNIPFWSLTYDNLEVLSVFAAYFASQWSNLNLATPLLKTFPTASAEFLSELQTLVHLKTHNNIDSLLTCLTIPPELQTQSILYILERQKRSLDCIWIDKVQSHYLFISLLPLTSMEGSFGYRKRIATLLKNEFGLPLNENGLNLRCRPLNSDDVNDQLQDFIKELSHDIV